MRCHREHESPPGNSEHPIRAFDPFWNDLYQGHPSDIIGACECCGENKIKVLGVGHGKHRKQKLDPNSIVVSIASDCRNAGTDSAQASWGVFYGPEARLNDQDQLSEYDSGNQSVEGGVIAAAREVLVTLSAGFQVQWGDDREDGYRWNGCQVCKILILTDSQYLVQGISQHIWKWKQNGFRNSKNKPVRNGDAFEALDGMMMMFEAENIPVWFWHVKREFNQEADALAKHALDYKPKPSLYLEDPETGKITTGRDWIFDSTTGKYIPAPAEPSFSEDAFSKPIEPSHSDSEAVFPLFHPEGEEDPLTHFPPLNGEVLNASETETPSSGRNTPRNTPPETHRCQADQLLLDENAERPIRIADPAWEDKMQGIFAGFWENCSCCGEMKILLKRGSDGVVFDHHSVIAYLTSIDQLYSDDSTRVAYGVYYGLDSKSNFAQEFPMYENKSVSRVRQRAAISAAIRVLEQAVSETRSHVNIDGQTVYRHRKYQIFILTDNQNLVNGIGKNIWTWDQNGYLNSKKTPVVNADLFEYLHSLVICLESRGTRVLFWHTKGSHIQEAFQLARNALDASVSQPHEANFASRRGRGKIAVPEREARESFFVEANIPTVYNHFQNLLTSHEQ